MKGIRKIIQYQWSNPKSETGVLFIRYNDDGIRRQKSFAWGPCNRTHDEALDLAKEFIITNHIPH